LRGDFSLDADPVTGYFDNLQLVERTLGEIRRAMELSGTWETTTVLLTADHSWPESPSFDGRRDFRVPFVFKLAGQRTPVAYHAVFNTTAVHDLTVAALNGELAGSADVVRWLDRHRAASPRAAP
jgi:arylsulfatase A-like enzyme